MLIKFPLFKKLLGTLFVLIVKEILKLMQSNGSGVQKEKHGGLGLKDLRLQGIALAVKWLAKASVGKEPWKILIRHNLRKRHLCGENL